MIHRQYKFNIKKKNGNFSSIRFLNENNLSSDKHGDKNMMTFAATGKALDTISNTFTLLYWFDLWVLNYQTDLIDNCFFQFRSNSYRYTGKKRVTEIESMYDALYRNLVSCTHGASYLEGRS